MQPLGDVAAAQADFERWLERQPLATARSASIPATSADRATADGELVEDVRMCVSIASPRNYACRLRDGIAIDVSGRGNSALICDEA